VVHQLPPPPHTHTHIINRCISSGLIQLSPLPAVLAALPPPSPLIHPQKVVDFQWCPFDPWLMMSISESQASGASDEEDEQQQLDEGEDSDGGGSEGMHLSGGMLQVRRVVGGLVGGRRGVTGPVMRHMRYWWQVGGASADGCGGASAAGDESEGRWQGARCR
jgi:hypothetical protein